MGVHFSSFGPKTENCKFFRNDVLEKIKVYIWGKKMSEKFSPVEILRVLHKKGPESMGQCKSQTLHSNIDVRNSCDSKMNKILYLRKWTLFQTLIVTRKV